MKSIFIPYGGPLRLSDPGKDFSDEELQGIINTKDSDLGWFELACIFQSYLPAGTYEECAYFIPYALDFIAMSHDESSCLLENFILWFGDNPLDDAYFLLKRDGLLDPIMERLHGYLLEWTSRFDLIENKDGFLYPKNCGEVTTMFAALNRSFQFYGKGDEWISEVLLPPKTYFQAAWFIYFLQATTLKSELISSLRKDSDLKEVALNIIYDNVLSCSDQQMLEYWDRELRYFW
jgi:hypothetical protein